MLNKLHLNSIHCAQGGMYVTGLKSGGMLLFNGKKVQMAAELPAGTHNARPFRDGVLFNDTDADAVRYAGRGEGREDRAIKVPRYAPEELLNRHSIRARPRARVLRAGLCVLSASRRGGRLVTLDGERLRPRRERARDVRQPVDGRAQRNPWSRGLALRVRRRCAQCAQSRRVRLVVLTQRRSQNTSEMALFVQARLLARPQHLR